MSVCIHRTACHVHKRWVCFVPNSTESCLSIHCGCPIWNRPNFWAQARGSSCPSPQRWEHENHPWSDSATRLRRASFWNEKYEKKIRDFIEAKQNMIHAVHALFHRQRYSFVFQKKNHFLFLNLILWLLTWVLRLVFSKPRTNLLQSPPEES